MQAHTEEGTGRVINDPWFLTTPGGDMVSNDNTYWWSTREDAIEAGKTLLRKSPKLGTLYVNRQFAAITLQLYPVVEEFA